MNINIKLDKNFTTVFNKLVQTYGEQLRKLNGFSDSQLNYTDFIDNFVDKNTVADATIDGNANVGTKDICSLTAEMNKPHSKLLAFNKIFYEMNKKYGYKCACDWLTQQYLGGFYLHDAPSTSYVPYCIVPEECCSFIYEGKRIHCSFIDIYELIKSEQFYDKENGVWYKKPLNLLVLDYDRENKVERYTMVSAISKKETNKDFYFVKSYDGANLITTEDHKFITTNGDVHASELIEDENILYCVDDSKLFTNSIYEYNGLNLTSDIGWLIGMYLTEGYNQKGQTFTAEYQRIIDVLKNQDNNWERKILKIVKGKHCNEKRLCVDYTHFNDEFLKGIIAGIIDGEGTVAKNATCMIRMTSRTLINQIREIGLHFGIFFSSRLPYVDSKEAKICQKFPMYSANINMNRDKEFFLSLPSIKIKDTFNNFEYSESSNNNHICKFGELNVRDVQKTYRQTNLVFDLSTESHTFVCNNILVHNCFAYDIENLVKKGLYFIDRFNNQPPKHLDTYTDFVGQFVSWASNRSSGAVGLPSFLLYSFYFWKKDCETGYANKSSQYYRDHQFQRIIYKLNQPYLRVNQSAFTNFSIFDRDYLIELFGGKEFPDGTFIIDYIEQILQYQKKFMQVVSDIRSQNMMTFPVLTFALLRDKNGVWGDEQFAKWCCKHNMKWADSNFFISDNVTSLSNCCRLVSDVKQLGYFNSIGGSALQVGSVKVNTINLARLAYENKKQDYLNALQERVILCLKALDVIRGIIKRNAEKGLLPNYSLHIMDMKNQYNTIGIIGIYQVLNKYEMVKKDQFGYSYYSNQGIQFSRLLLQRIKDIKNEFAKDKDYKINIEQVPAQRAASLLMQKDKLFFKGQKYQLPLYGNQWIPLAVKTTLDEKIKISALLDSFCEGGSISHINLSAPFSNFDQAWDMLNKCADAGVRYFAFCLRISACVNNHGFFGDVCPICGQKKITSYQRIVGFLVAQTTYSKQRKEQFKLRDWFDVLSGQDLK